MSKSIIAKNDNGIFSLTLNRPDKKNALISEMYNLLYQGFETAAKDPTVKVVLIKGNGENFTSGNDLNEFATWDKNQTNFEEFPAVKWLKQVITFEKPIVVAVKGTTVGIGTTLLLHCDIVVAGQSTIFNLPFVRLGLVPEFASSLLLPTLAGKALASQALLLGEPFNLETAKTMGLVSVACDDDEVDEVALTKCRKFVSLPPRAVRTIKRMITPTEQKEKLLATIDKEMQLFTTALSSLEHQEALNAFFEKRRPDFSNFT